MGKSNETVNLKEFFSVLPEIPSLEVFNCLVQCSDQCLFECETTAIPKV